MDTRFPIFRFQLQTYKNYPVRSHMLIDDYRTACQCFANLAFLCLVHAHLASKVMYRAFSTRFNRNATTALANIAIMQINARIARRAL